MNLRRLFLSELVCCIIDGLQAAPEVWQENDGRIFNPNTDTWIEVDGGRELILVWQGSWHYRTTGIERLMLWRAYQQWLKKGQQA